MPGARRASTTPAERRHPRSPAPPLDALRRIVAPFEGADDRRAWWTLVTSVLPYPLLWWLMYESLATSYGLTLLLALPAAGFIVRTFTVQHDCGHGSFFHDERLRVAVGRLCSLVTLTPFTFFRRLHGVHHATSGKLHERGVDIETLTVREYLALSRVKQLQYRITRHPLVMFGIAPILYFTIALRLPLLARPTWVRERRSILLTDLAVVVTYGLLIGAVGWRAFVMVQLPVSIVASSVGIWFFYVQHQFEETYWAGEGEWDYARAALEGSSYLALPAVLEWFTGYIGFHHVHHLSPRVPSYRLTACHRAHDVLAGVPRLGLRDAIRCSRLKLWDEESRRLVGWVHAPRRAGTP